MVRTLVALNFLATCLVAAVAFADPPAAKAETPAAKAAAPDVLVVGDSQAQGVAGALIRRYLRSKDFHVVDKSKVGTGLYSKSTYDWDAVVAELATTEHAKVAIVMFGANDRPPVRIKGTVDAALAEKFSKNYSARVEKIVKSLRDAKIDVLWLGDPVVKDADYTADMQLLNQVMEPAAEKEGAQWISLWDLGVDPDGSYDAFGKALDGQTKRLRADDGVHFTPSGYDLIAARLDPILKTLTTAPAAGGGGPAAAPAAKASAYGSPIIQPAAAITQ
jgi:hypothetical protein